MNKLEVVVPLMTLPLTFSIGEDEINNLHQTLYIFNDELVVFFFACFYI